jgi:hypothetical protein
MGSAAADHFRRGLAAYKERSYARAADEFRAGYALDPHPDFLFPWAQAERLAGRCRQALPLYHKVLATGLPPAEEENTLRLIERCDAELARRARAGEARRAVPAAPAIAAPPRPARRPPWYHDVWTDVLLGAGLAAAGLGAGFLASSRSANRAARAADTLDEFARDSGRARDRRLAGAVALGAGGALLAGALVRYIAFAPDRDGPADRAVRGDARPARPAVSLWLSASDPALTAGLVIAGRF